MLRRVTAGSGRSGRYPGGAAVRGSVAVPAGPRRRPSTAVRDVGPADEVPQRLRAASVMTRRVVRRGGRGPGTPAPVRDRGGSPRPGTMPRCMQMAIRAARSLLRQCAPIGNSADPPVELAISQLRAVLVEYSDRVGGERHLASTRSLMPRRAPPPRVRAGAPAAADSVRRSRNPRVQASADGPPGESVSRSPYRRLPSPDSTNMTSDVSRSCGPRSSSRHLLCVRRRRAPL